MKRLCLLFAPALLLCASDLAAKEVKGTVTLHAKNFFAIQFRTRKPSDDKLCKTTFGYVAGLAKVTYTINTNGGAWAEMTFHGKRYLLFNIGSYYFINNPPNSPPIQGIGFSLSEQFTNPHVTFSMDIDPTLRCMLTDDSMPPSLENAIW